MHSSTGLVGPETTKARGRHSPPPIDFVSSSIREDSRGIGDAQGVSALISALKLTSRSHANAGLMSSGCESHRELALARFYADQAAALSLCGEGR